MSNYIFLYFCNGRTFRSGREGVMSDNLVGSQVKWRSVCLWQQNTFILHKEKYNSKE